MGAHITPKVTVYYTKLNKESWTFAGAEPDGTTTEYNYLGSGERYGIRLKIANFVQLVYNYHTSEFDSYRTHFKEHVF